MLSEVRLVEIEIHSKCNRKCLWCPNRELDRTKFIEMSSSIYKKFLYELRDGNFSGTITYSRYNEPFYDISLFKKRVKEAKSILPDVKLVTNTNGDFLSRENLDGLLIDDLTIMDYDCIGLYQCQRRLIELGVKITKLDYPYIYGTHKNISKVLYFVDWPRHALFEDRGGFLRDKNLRWKNNRERRKRPCLEPRYFIAVDYNGNVTPCCHIRSDIKEHKPYILGNLYQQDIVTIFYSDKARKFRELLSSNKYDEYPFPCQHCQKDAGRYTRDNPSIDFD